jgi:hypothetical protein
MLEVWMAPAASMEAAAAGLNPVPAPADAQDSAALAASMDSAACSAPAEMEASAAYSEPVAPEVPAACLAGSVAAPARQPFHRPALRSEEKWRQLCET